jgi:hypothetical protein
MFTPLEIFYLWYPGSINMPITQSEQAMLIWPVLSLAAKLQRVLTYGEVEGMTGIPPHGQAHALGLIHSYCKGKKYPALNAIVVLASSGFPGAGFPENMTESELLIERARVFAFDWSSKDKPRPEDFEIGKSATA